MPFNPSLIPSLALCLAAGAFLAGCSAGGAAENKPRGSGSGAGGLNVGSGGTGSGGINVGAGGTLGLGGNLGGGTTLSGTVYDPSGTLPLYGVVVYVPSEPLAAISEGASCETCDGNFSGRPIAAAVSDSSGHFVINLANVPQNSNIPLVVQVGKWRREMTVDTITANADTPLPDGTVRLPRDRSEGNLPKIAVVRGGSDTLECLFRKIGVSESEFTTDSGDGLVHLYVTDQTKDAPTGQLATGENLTLASTLFLDLPKMMTYDVIFMGCDGQGHTNYDTFATNHGPTIFSNVQTYADQGGRVFGSHYPSYLVRTERYAEDGVLPYGPVVDHAESGQGDIGVAVGDVNTTFPKGQAFSDWLLAVGASTEPAKLPLQGVEHFTDGVVGATTAWITLPQPSIQYHSFTTPLGAAECGRMVFSDLHVGSGTGDNPEIAFPTNCVSTTLSPQEKALAFMLFDLSSCVQADSDPIIPPIVF